MPQRDYIELHRKRHGFRLDHFERKCKKEAHEDHKGSKYAQKALVIKCKMFAEKALMKKTLAMHEESSTSRKVHDDVHEGVVPAYLRDRETTTQAKVLSNTIKQKWREKKLGVGQRQLIYGAIMQDVADPGVLFTILICKHEVVIHVSSQKAALHLDEMLLLANFVISSKSFRSFEYFSSNCRVEFFFGGTNDLEGSDLAFIPHMEEAFHLALQLFVEMFVKAGCGGSSDFWSIVKYGESGSIISFLLIAHRLLVPHKIEDKHQNGAPECIY
ncbi:uncharacterized protein LOC121239482 [Juglans microcarpa x Juglans regia]|uniref:uncharacterized protein LOC121239482 n=1 Tax=Juglans microcarpa x Juglans regia TaxID=2249226 RepID=UPI001B7DA131|nr:uncharacterized protein LOC121239482 [Juglans microcarpa x Juglans regia]